MARVEPSLGEPKMLIDGKLVESVSGERFETINPATGKQLTTIPRGNVDDVERAVAAADAAAKHWRDDFTVKERADKLFKFAELLKERTDKFGAIDAADSGNPYGQMKDDATMAAELVEMFAGVASEIKGDTIPVSNDSLDYTLKQPYGVVARIIPYNHPVLFGASKIAAPLVAGNTVVLKPPEQDSTGVMELARLIAEHDVFPDGVVNVVSGFGDEVGSELVRHTDVRKVGFIGSVPTGSIIQKQAADTITDVILELGGKNPCIVYPDADLEQAIDGTVGGMNIAWCGQSCGSISRLFLHESVYEEGIELLRNRLESIEPGDPLDPETEMGSLVSEDQYEKVMKYVELGKKSDARLVCGGASPDGEQYEDGFFVEPTMFADVTMEMRIAQEEVFGPLLFVFEWSDENDVIQQANNVEYGLTASIWTDDLTRAHRTAERVEAGYVWINNAGPHFVGAPFGGWKSSGIGREEAIEEIFEFTQTKNVNVQL
ncbi:aldehyde dehydrogenase family protein [Saliphagus sp. GCM10025334]